MPDLYCISHTAPIFDPCRAYTLICSDQTVADVHISDLHYGESYDGHIISEYTQLFGLSDFLQDKNKNFINVFQYRKFVTPKEAKLSSNVPWNRVCKPDEASNYFLFDSPDIIITGPKIEFDTLTRNYYRAHIIEDFVCFTNAMCESKLFTPAKIKKFVNCKYLIPSPSIGVYTAEFLFAAVDTLKVVWGIFYKNYYEKRHDYQRRVGGFLLERLHSFLLLEYLDTANMPCMHANIVVVSRDDSVQNTI